MLTFSDPQRQHRQALPGLPTGPISYANLVPEGRSMKHHTDMSDRRRAAASNALCKPVLVPVNLVEVCAAGGMQENGTRTGVPLTSLQSSEPERFPRHDKAQTKPAPAVPALTLVLTFICFSVLN